VLVGEVTVEVNIGDKSPAEKLVTVPDPGSPEDFIFPYLS
jgi:hypothetical protein